MASIRVRFAPSPTGHLHIGGLRTALFNWLFARHHKGSFLIRIEDTDRERSHQDFVDSICQSLSWAGLISDEPLVFQSQRVDYYCALLQKLLDEEKAYRCFCPTTSERIGEDYFKYDGRCRTKKVTQEDMKQPHAIRFKFPLDQEIITFNDLIHGPISFSANQFDDFVLLRTDGLPIYNFVVVADDIAMNISHVIRGEDHIANTPKQLMIYKALDASVPYFAHVPLILGPSGQPLSKRDAATSAHEYKERGYFADAMINYLVRLGWSQGNQEVFSREQLIALFSLDHVGKSGAIFDQAKLDWLNGMYLKQMTPEVVLTTILKDVRSSLLQEISWNREKIIAWIALFQDRVKTLSALAQKLVAIFKKTEQPTEDQMRLLKDQHANEHLKMIKSLLITLDDFSVPSLTSTLKEWCKKNNLSLITVTQPLRAALIGAIDGPSAFAILSLFGKEESICAIDAFLVKV